VSKSSPPLSAPSRPRSSREQNHEKERHACI
jgi:hypothetical protein